MPEGRWSDWQVRLLLRTWQRNDQREIGLMVKMKTILHRSRVGHILQLDNYTLWS